MMLPLFGLGLAPLFVAGALRFIDWRLDLPRFCAARTCSRSRGLAVCVPDAASTRAARRTSAECVSGNSLCGLEGAFSRYSNVRIAAALDALLAHLPHHDQCLHAQLSRRLI